MTEETTPVFDADKIEAELLAAHEAKASDPAEQAAQIFRMYKNRFEKAIEKLSAKSTKRLIRALVMAPLENAPLVNQQEQEAYFYGNTMLEAKLIMQLTVMNNSTEEILAEYDKMKEASSEGEKDASA